MTRRHLMLNTLAQADNDALDVLNAVLAATGDPLAATPTGVGTIRTEEPHGPQVDHATAVRLRSLDIVRLVDRRVVLTQLGALVQLAALADWYAAPPADPALLDRAAADAATVALLAGWPTELIDLRIRPLLELALGRRLTPPA